MSKVAVRLAAVSPEGTATRNVLQKGGRVWVFRDMDGSPLGDRLCTLLGVEGEVVVLSPKGFGRPLLARNTQWGWRGLPNGEPCAVERWLPTGGVAAWLHAAGAPFRGGPMLALGNATMGGEAFVAVRARALVTEEARQSVLRLLEGALEVQVLEDGLVATLPAAGEDLRIVMARLERVALRLRVLMPDVRMAAAADAEAAARLGACVDAGWLGVAPGVAVAAWKQAAAPGVGISIGRRVGRWKGPSIPDIDGVVSLSRTMSSELPMQSGGGSVRVGLHGERGFCIFRVPYRRGCTAPQVASQVAAAVCEHFFQVGAVTAVSVALIEELEQLLPQVEPEVDHGQGQLALLPGWT